MSIFTIGQPAFSYTSSDTSINENPQSTCVLTEAKGIVQKRTHEDWTTDCTDQFVAASKGDRLKEGMQVATGERSYAQLTWPDVVSRAWANSIYSIAPGHRLVYLQSGQMLFNLDKHRKDKREYVLWTNMLQARVRGTTVFVQSDGNHSQIAVLEGYIDVMNRKDKSVVRVYPGVVYDIQGTQPTSGSAATSAITSMVPITAGNAVPLFATNQTKVSVFAPNTNNLYKGPLVTGFDSALPSLPLVNQTLGSLPTALTNVVGNTVGNTIGTLTNTLSKVAQILKVPTAVDYAIGSVVGNVFSLPSGAMQYFPPVGYIANDGAGGANLAGLTQGTPGNISMSGFTSIGAATSAAAAANLAGRVAQTANITQLVNTSSIAARVSGTNGGVMGGVTSGIGGTLGGLGGTINGVTGTVGGVVGGVGGTVGGVVGGVGGTVGGVVGGVGGTLGGLTGGLTGGGFHFP